MKNTSINWLSKKLPLLTIAMLLSVNALAEEPQSSAVQSSKEWTAVRKHVDTKSISVSTSTNDEKLLAEVVAYSTSK
ncbi:MAG: hypothetical protein NT163_05830 [Chlorobiales bacterium]|nr:hypothetical protein [Chlorobiales bacterium]